MVGKQLEAWERRTFAVDDESEDWTCHLRRRDNFADGSSSSPVVAPGEAGEIASGMVGAELAISPGDPGQSSRC